MKDIKKNKVKMIGELQDLRRPRPVNLNPSKTSAMGIKIPLRFSPSLIFGLLIFFVTINQFLWFNTASAESQTESRISKSQAPKSILILYSAGLHLPAYRKNLVAFYSGLERAGFPAKNVYFEQLDLIQINSQAYRRNLLELLRIKYAGKNIDLIVTLEGLARDYILKEGRDFFPQAPLLAVLSADTLLKNDSSRRLVQIPSILGFAETLEGAMTLFPHTKQLFVVVGSGEDEQRWEQDARSRFAPWTGKLKFEFSSGLTYEEMLQRISSLPADAIVLYVAFFKDKTGRAFIPRDVAINLTKKSNAPVFGLYDEILPLVVGGFMISYGNEGDRAAKLALDILNGHFPLNQPLTTLPILITPQFNWIQLDRWGVSTNQLPKGSLVINQPASIWKDYKRYVLVFLVLLFLQSGMIIALLELHRRRKRAELNRKIAEAALSESEERYRTAIE
ncbi:MAG TPA: hypothetical protein VK564_06815, partial [Thermodesulfobacteriota bacterium]|nr:hypothetical protein [Thermodesulfobacteriota bacterium]